MGTKFRTLDFTTRGIPSERRLTDRQKASVLKSSQFGPWLTYRDMNWKPFGQKEIWSFIAGGAGAIILKSWYFLPSVNAPRRRA